jgi:hypothetical protein
MAGSRSCRANQFALAENGRFATLCGQSRVAAIGRLDESTESTRSSSVRVEPRVYGRKGVMRLDQHLEELRDNADLEVLLEAQLTWFGWKIRIECPRFDRGIERK